MLNSIYNHFSLLFFNYINSWFGYLSIAVLIISIIIFNYKYNVNISLKFLINFLFILLISFLYLFPYQRGKEINTLLEIGYKIVNEVQIYKSKNGSIPNNLSYLSLEQFSLEDKNLINNNIKYKYYDHKVMNKRFNQENSPNKFIEDYYELNIKPPFMSPEYFYYKHSIREFKVID